MTRERLMEKLQNYKKALARLEEAIAEKEPNQYVYDAVVKRFEFTYELAWRVLKAYLEYAGIADLRFPREIFKEAYAKGLLPDGEVWLEMWQDRNLSSHPYSQERAIEIYSWVREKYLQEFVRLAATVEGEMRK
ncbi:MAG: hypothetical protein PWQ91_427 [Eubacteriales bacterium]|nr:hypothetical protein [Eubacteriales bacterium]MDN5363366.1 hypothetical protein [Eubacteriales bacterium]